MVPAPEQEASVPHIDRIKRAPPSWRDPEFPDIPQTGLGGGLVWLVSSMRELQEQRGLPPITQPLRPWEGRPTMRLAWWDKKQKKTRSVEIWGDIVMTPRQWNCLHPAARRLVPHRLLPPAVLGIGLHAPTPELV